MVSQHAVKDVGERSVNRLAAQCLQHHARDLVIKLANLLVKATVNELGDTRREVLLDVLSDVQLRWRITHFMQRSCNLRTDLRGLL